MNYQKLVAGLSLATLLGSGCVRSDTVIGVADATIASDAKPEGVLTGKAAFADWQNEKPGVRRHITTADLPEPFATQSVFNFPRVVPRPEGAWPQVPAGFVVTEFATGLINPRQIITAPNGDLFITES